MAEIIISSFKESVHIIWKKKMLFLLLFILQIIFLSAFFALSNNYIPKMLQHAKAMSEYLSSQNLDETTMTQSLMEQKDVLGEDPLAISRNFDGVVRNFRIYFIYSFILILAFISVSWGLTNRMAKRHSGNFLKIILIAFILAAFYLALVFSFFYSLLNITFLDVASQGAGFLSKYVPFIILSIVLAYFMFISLSLAGWKSYSQLARNTLEIGIKKAHYMLAAYFINILLFVFLIFMVFYFIDRLFVVSILSLLFFIASFVFARIFVVNVVNKLEEMG